MARTKKSADKAAGSAQEARDGLDMNVDIADVQEPSGAAQGDATGVEAAAPDDPADLPSGAGDADETELEEGTLTEYAVTAEGGLRLRERPDGNAPVIATLPWGAGVFADEEPIGEWIPVTTGLLSGYMMGRHLAPLSPGLRKMAAGHE